MAMIGGFLGGGIEMVPAGKHQIFLWWNTSDRKNTSGVTFTLTPSSGNPITVNADEYGRAEALVDVGVYTVTISHTGTYSGDGPQILNATSAECTPLIFYGVVVEQGLSLLDVYPVGSIYMSVSSTSPATLFGGTWSRIAQGRTLIGQGTSDQSFEAGDTGGSSTHELTEDEMPSHTHTYSPVMNYFKNGSYSYYLSQSSVQNSGTKAVLSLESSSSYGRGEITCTEDQTTDPSGAGSAHNNLPPYLVVYIWKRTR